LPRCARRKGKRQQSERIVEVEAVDLFLSSKLRKRKRSVTLDEVTSWIGEHVVEDADVTAVIREMRDKQYDY
jgi:hypothetical protein